MTEKKKYDVPVRTLWLDAIGRRVDLSARAKAVASAIAPDVTEAASKNKGRTTLPRQARLLKSTLAARTQRSSNWVRLGGVELRDAGWLLIHEDELNIRANTYEITFPTHQLELDGFEGAIEDAQTSALRERAHEVFEALRKDGSIEDDRAAAALAAIGGGSRLEALNGNFLERKSAEVDFVTAYCAATA